MMSNSSNLLACTSYTSDFIEYIKKMLSYHRQLLPGDYLIVLNNNPDSLNPYPIKEMIDQGFDVNYPVANKWTIVLISTVEDLNLFKLLYNDYIYGIYQA